MRQEMMGDGAKKQYDGRREHKVEGFLKWCFNLMER